MHALQDSFLPTLHADCVQNLFLSLDIDDLAVAKRVCLLWEKVGRSPHLLANLCHTFAFIPQYSKIWAGLPIDEQARFCAYQDLPRDIVKILTSPCPISQHPTQQDDARSDPPLRSKKIFETHFLLYIPAQKNGCQADSEISFKSIAKERHIGQIAMQDLVNFFDQLPPQNAYWMLVTRKCIKIETTFSYSCLKAQKTLALISNQSAFSYTLPTCQELFVLAGAKHFPNKICAGIFCNSAIQSKHFEVQNFHITEKNCELDRFTSPILAVHKLTGISSVFKFAALPFEIRTSILTWVPEAEYSRCGLVSKSFFSSRWPQYLKETSLVLPGNDYCQCIAYAHLFYNFFNKSAAIMEEFKFLQGKIDSIRCANSILKPLSIFSKVARLKEIINADSYSIKYALIDLCRDDLSDLEFRLILATHSTALQHKFAYFFKNTRIEDASLELLLDCKDISNDTFIRAVENAILSRRPLHLVNQLLQQCHLKNLYFHNYADSRSDYFCIKDHTLPPYIELLFNRTTNIALSNLSNIIEERFSSDFIIHASNAVSFENTPEDASSIKAIFQKAIKLHSSEILRHFIIKFKEFLSVDFKTIYALFSSKFSEDLIRKALQLPFDGPSNRLIEYYCQLRKDAISEETLTELLKIDSSEFRRDNLHYAFKDRSEQMNFQMYARFVQHDTQVSYQPHRLSKFMLNLALKRNYREDFVLQIAHNLPNISVKQLQMARQKGYSSEVLACLQAKVKKINASQTKSKVHSPFKDGPYF